MSEALCQCGHAQMSHFGIVGQGSCQINVGRSRCQCVKYVPPTREPIRLTGEERAQLRGVLHEFKSRVCDDGCSDGLYAAVESILAARLAGGPTLPNVCDLCGGLWDEHHPPFNGQPVTADAIPHNLGQPTFNQCEVHGKCLDENWNDDAGNSHAACLGPIPDHVLHRLHALRFLAAMKEHSTARTPESEDTE